MHIRYEDIGSPIFTGRFPFRTCLVDVKMQHLTVWKIYPTAVFEALFAKPNQQGRILVLSRWSVPPQYGNRAAMRRDQPAGKKASYMKEASRHIYTSSNGNRWALQIDSNGDPVVRHTPTLSSGGVGTHIEVGNFLTRDRGSPQHQELLRMIATLVEAEPDRQIPSAATRTVRQV